MTRTYSWRGGSGSLAVASHWNDVTNDAVRSTLVPGSTDDVRIPGLSGGVISVSGALAVAAVAITGGVAISGAVSAGTLTVAGTLALASGGSFTADAATLSAGALAASGAGTQFTVAGTLTLAGDASAAGGAAIAASRVQIANGTLETDALSAISIGAAAQAGTLSVGASALLSGSGRLVGPVADAGMIAASGTLSVFGAVTGGGTLAIGAGATLFLAGAVDAGLTAAFAGTGGVLEVFTTAAAFGAIITGFAAGDGIDVASASLTGANWSAGVLTLVATDGSTLALALPGGSARDTYVTLPDGMGGSLVQLAPASVAAPAGGNATFSAAGLVLLGGTAGHAATLSVGGTVALATALSANTLIQSGTFAVLDGAAFTVGTASVSAGVLLAEGAAALTVSGKLTLGGGLSGFGGAALTVGTLTLAGGTVALDATSSLAVGGATGEAGRITVAAGNAVTGRGVVAAPLDLAGGVQAQGGVLTLLGGATGGGRLAIAAGATLAAFGPVAVTVGFAAGATLDLFGPVADFTGRMDGFFAGNAIDVASASFDSAAWSAGSLTLMSAGAAVGTLALTGDYSGQDWQVTPDGGGGSLVTLSSSGGPLVVTATLRVPGLLSAPSVSAQPGATVAMAGGTLTTGTLTLAAGATLHGSGTVAAAVADAGAVLADGGSLTVTGGISGTGAITIANGATLYARGGIAPGMVVAFNAIGNTLELFGSAISMQARLGNLGVGNVIDIAGASVTSAAYTAGAARGTGSLTLAGPSGWLGSIFLFGNYTGYTAATIPDQHGGTLISLVPCFVAGTRIATPHGEIPVEALRVGDSVLTPHGARRLQWVARRRCDAAAAPELRPVRISAGALGGALPRRDLLLSPQHALLLRGVLVPAVALVNEGSIQREAASMVQYHHLGLATHSTVRAEGVATETYLPSCAAARFDVEAGHRPAPGRPCAVRLEGGPALEALRGALFRTSPAAPAGALLGHVERMTERADATWLEGWALDPANPSRPVVLPVWRDGTTSGVAVANVWRPDLDRAGLGGGRCAFNTWVPGPSLGLSLRRPGDPTTLPVQR